MNWKIALALSALVTSVAAFAACGSDPCTEAESHLAACMSNLASTSSSSSSGMAPACSLPDCQAQCINNATCSEINGMVPTFKACLTHCVSP